MHATAMSRSSIRFAWLWQIADALAPDDVREHARIIGVLEEVAAAFAEVFFHVVEQLPDPEPEQTQQQSRRMSQ